MSVSRSSAGSISVQLLLLLSACCAGLLSTVASAAEAEFSAAEVQRILSHGPWPPAPTVDAGNAVDGRPEAIELGRRLFGDPRLSASGEMACTSCHLPALAFQDNHPHARRNRNTPSLLDAVSRRWYGWGGAQDSLWAATLVPLTAADELAATPASAAALLAQDTALGKRYRAVFGVPPTGARLLVNLSKALAAYQATLVSPRTAFDDFRDALSRGDSAVMARYPQSARRGLKLFVGSGRCFFCHSGPAFTNGEFADIGRPFFTADGVDAGRWGGLQQLRDSPFTRLGSHSDAGPDDARAVATRHVVTEPRHFGEFKVPGLRGLAATAPYFHDGSASSVEEVVRHYSELDENRLHADGARILVALKLTPQQSADLAAFLRSLSESSPLCRGNSPPCTGALSPRDRATAPPQLRPR